MYLHLFRLRESLFFTNHEALALLVARLSHFCAGHTQDNMGQPAISSVRAHFESPADVSADIEGDFKYHRTEIEVWCYKGLVQHQGCALMK